MATASSTMQTLPAEVPPVATSSRTSATGWSRIDPVDLLRGLVMVIMLLDHTRDFTHWATWQFDPTDLTRTSMALFLTRWITHFCAPIFVFLAGTGAYLQLARGKTKGQLSRFLWTRGVWLVVLEFTVVRTAVLWDLNYQFLGMAQVIWVLGVSMIVLAALIHLPLKAIAVFGIAMIVLHNAFDVFSITGWQGPGSPVPGALDKLWMLLHQSGAFPVAGWPSPVVFVLYPLIPWIGVMAAGYAFGSVYDMDAERRRVLLVRLGVALIAAFVVIRAVNFYGDPWEWSVQKNAVFTVMSFLNTSKYPPSLLFLLMTLGPAMVALAWFERAGTGAVARGLITFGRVPLFFYVLQWIYAHGMGYLLHLVAGKPTAHMVGAPFSVPVPETAGFPLGVTYLAWLAGIVLLYPLCRWYAGVKARRRDWWLSYL